MAHDPAYLVKARAGLAAAEADVAAARAAVAECPTIVAKTMLGYRLDDEAKARETLLDALRRRVSGA